MTSWMKNNFKNLFIGDSFTIIIFYNIYLNGKLEFASNKAEGQISKRR